MNNITIEKFCETNNKMSSESCIRIDFKKRQSLYGFIIASADYEDLKSKNLWRIVTHNNLENWKKTKDLDFAKIFNGNDFARLTFEKTGVKAQ